MTFLLAVCMAVSLLAVPAGAANTAAVTFSDVGDKSTAVAVESLRLLGVLDGYGDGTFRPGTVLTRAQFCKMAVYAMNGSNELGRYRTVTVFSDVKPSYWAAPYINMAAKGKDIISGYADGRFHPDRTVTVGQAVTILMRMLGYKDEDIGGIWPDSYMAEAATVGLTEGVSTNGSAGIETAYALAEKFYLEDGNNRVILATDGDLNVGVTSEHALSELISRKKESGVYLTALGFGTGNLQDNKLETLADDGNGMYAYIDSVTEARKVLVEELGANMVTVAEDVKLQATFSPAQVAQYRLIGYENRLLSQEDFEDDTKDAGEIGAGHTVTALYELVLTDQALAPENADAWMTLDVRYKKPHAKTSQLLEYQLLASDYTDFPSEDFQFASCVAQFGMIVRNSAYCGGSVLQDVRERLNAMGEQTDVYRAEFCDLVNTLEE